MSKLLKKMEYFLLHTIGVVDKPSPLINLSINIFSGRFALHLVKLLNL